MTLHEVPSFHPPSPTTPFQTLPPTIPPTNPLLFLSPPLYLSYHSLSVYPPFISNDGYSFRESGEKKTDEHILWQMQEIGQMRKSGV